MIAPILENVLLGDRKGLKVLYITPTRALVNDFFRRDELHLLDNTPRGDQLRMLLIRLRKMLEKRDIKIQYCALSATIDDIEIGKRYFEDRRSVFLNHHEKLNIF